MTDNDVVSDFDKDSQGHVCVNCECDSNFHRIFWKCPLYDKELICTECCQENMLELDAPIKVSAKLGRTITAEELNKICSDCGRNYACQNKELAQQIELGDVPNDKQTPK